GGAAKGLVLAGWKARGFGRKELDELTKVARAYGAGGLGWIVFDDAAEGGVSSPLAKFLSPEDVAALAKGTEAADGDLVLVVSDRRAVANRALGEVRLALGDLLGLRPSVEPTDPEAWKLLWVTDMPLVEWNETDKRWDPAPHPSTAPTPQDEALLHPDTRSVTARP